MSSCFNGKIKLSSSGGALSPIMLMICIGYTPRVRLLSDLATECCTKTEVCNQLVHMTTQNSKIRLISSIALKSRLIT